LRLCRTRAAFVHERHWLRTFRVPGVHPLDAKSRARAAVGNHGVRRHGRTAVLDEKKWATGVEHTARLFQRPRRRPGYGERRERRDLLHQSFDRDHAGRSMDLPTLKIAWKNSDGWPHSELKKMVVTLTAMAAIAQTG